MSSNVRTDNGDQVVPIPVENVLIMKYVTGKLETAQQLVSLGTGILGVGVEMMNMVQNVKINVVIV